MRSLTLVFLSLVTSAHLVLAGSHAWQPPPPVSSPSDDPTSSLLNRRYFYINPQVVGTANDRVPWPNKQIRYCYDSDASRQALRLNLKAAHERWVTTGLGKDFTFVEVSQEVCQGDRNNVLQITYTGPAGYLATYVGFPSQDSKLRLISSRGPTMALTDSTSVGMLEVVGNYAHELGHAWGLYHEHQNPAFWSGAQFSGSGTVFGTPNNGNWRCQNLKDYTNVAIGGLVVQTGNGGNRPIDMNQLCSNVMFAQRYEFSAGDYLPFPGSMGITTSPGTGPNDVDWDSIMIYPSGAGGIPDSSLPGPDNRMPILLKPDGTRIPINLYPSQLDIEALRKLYGSEQPLKSGLLQKVGGSTTNTFNKLFSSSQGGPSGCL